MTRPANDDVGTTVRRPLSPRQRLEMWERHKGVCCICTFKIDGIREPWIDEHIIPLAMGGSNDPENRGPAHVSCAKVKTSADLRNVAKAKRVKQRHLGIKKPSRMPGSRDSNIKLTMRGEVVDRRTGLPIHSRER